MMTGGRRLEAEYDVVEQCPRSLSLSLSLSLRSINRSASQSSRVSETTDVHSCDRAGLVGETSRRGDRASRTSHRVCSHAYAGVVLPVRRPTGVPAPAHSPPPRCAHSPGGSQIQQIGITRREQTSDDMASSTPWPEGTQHTATTAVCSLSLRIDCTLSRELALKI
jgi:hypothetical protein